MYFRTKWDWSFAGDEVTGYAGHALGYGRRVLIGRHTGAAHTDLGLARLGPGGQVDRHVHAFERCAYVFSGAPEVQLDDIWLQLQAGDYVLFPVGKPHAWRNPGAEEARWLELSSPQPQTSPASWPDTVFLAPVGAGSARRPHPGDPTTPYVGHYRGVASQSEALAVRGPARGRAPAGMDTALLAYSGITVKMLVDANLGADLLTMFMVDYEPGGAAQVHDHPFEEAYLFLEGEIEAEVDGEPMTLAAGDVLFCGVGVLHGFFNTSSGRVRWVETQAPQPPRRHSYRWPAQWQELNKRLPREGTA